MKLEQHSQEFQQPMISPMLPRLSICHWLRDRPRYIPRENKRPRTNLIILRLPPYLFQKSQLEVKTRKPEHTSNKRINCTECFDVENRVAMAESSDSCEHKQRQNIPAGKQSHTPEFYQIKNLSIIFDIKKKNEN